MIKEEAIEILSDMRAEYNIFSDDEEEATRYHALSWAIQALNEQQPDTSTDTQTDTPTDMISRQAALALAKDICVPIKDGTVYRHRCIDPQQIMDLPSAQPEIIRCRECKHHDGIRCFRWNSTIITGFDDFCSNGERRE